jgi:membrane carboxypeptidase/penicillin-binding protein PbpC
VRDRDGNVLRLTLSADQKFRIRTPLRDISPELIGAVGCIFLALGFVQR